VWSVSRPSGGIEPVDESRKKHSQLSFNASLKIGFYGSRVTSEGGLFLFRELDGRLGFGELDQQHLTDSCRGKDKQFPFVDLLWQSIYSRGEAALPGRRQSVQQYKGFCKVFRKISQGGQNEFLRLHVTT
jgi:hypothetical protein